MVQNHPKNLSPTSGACGGGTQGGGPLEILIFKIYTLTPTLSREAGEGVLFIQIVSLQVFKRGKGNILKIF